MNKLIPHLWIFIFFFITVFIINKVPDWYIISWWDFYQLINIKENISRYLFTWFNHSWQWQFNPLVITYPFYLIQQFLYNLWLTYSQISNFLIFQFLYLSFYSFYFSQKILFWTLKHNFIWPLAYSLNLFVLTILFYPWIISHHFLIYLFIPLLLSTFIVYIKSNDFINKKLLYFLVIFLISLIAYNNIAFLFALFFVQGILSGVYIFFNHSLIVKKIWKFVLTIFIQIIVWLVVLLPFLYSLYGYKEKAMNTKAFWWDISNIMLDTSTTPINAFRLIADDRRYPYIEKESKFNQIPNIYLILSSIFSIVFVLVIFYSLLIKKEKNNYLFYIFLVTYFILLFLSFRLTEPFYNINLIFYKNLTLWLFRSPDKIFVFIPFFLIILFIMSLQKINPNKKIIYGIFLSIFLSASFIFTWGIIKQYLYNTKWYTQWLVKIPNEYYNIQNIINDDDKINSILSIPYSVVNSLNWSNYPKWWYIWHDLLHLLYNKNYISANSYDHWLLETELSLLHFSNNNENINSLINVIQKFWWRYILNHKDVDNRFLWLTDTNLALLEKYNIIKRITSNDYFDLYEVANNYIYALINWSNLSFQKINPIKYNININISWENEKLYFLQSNNPQWEIFLNKKQNISWCNRLETYYNGWKKIIECEHKQTFFEWEELSYLYKKPLFENTHHLVYDYANWWNISKDEIIKYVDENYSKELQKEWYPKQIANGKLDYKYYILNSDGSIDVELTLYFKPQSYFYLGLIISGTTFIILMWYLTISYIRNRKNKENQAI